jgi:hypothetical protein
MANSNFVVHNGLTVGPLTINAATGAINTSGDITTSGNVNISGNIGVSAIQKNDTSITITDTGTNSTIVYNIDGSLRANMNASGMSISGAFGTTGNIIGGLAQFAALNATPIGNATASTGAFTSLTISGEIAATQADATALAIALGG